MIISIRLRDYPDVYVGKTSCSYALACDARREARKDAYYTNSFLNAGWWKDEFAANVWRNPTALKRTLTYSAYDQKHWDEVTWSAYEVVHLVTRRVESLDDFLQTLKGGK